MDKNIDFGYVADIYDYYTNVAFDIEFYKELCKGRTNILELMCGTGRVSLPLIKEGFPLTCIDYSEEMLEVFRAKLKVADSITDKTKIICQDVCDLNINERYDLIIIPSNSISEIIDKDKRKQAFRKIYDHLTSNGIFFCTLYNPQYRIKIADGNIRYLGKYDIDNNKTLVITYYNVYSSEKKLINGTQFYEIYDQNNRLVEKRCLDIQFSVISREEMCKAARETGFTLKALYGDYEPYHYDEKSIYMNFLFMKRFCHK